MTTTSCLPPNISYCHPPCWPGLSLCTAARMPLPPATSPWDPTLPTIGLLQPLPLFCTWTLLHAWHLGGTWDPPTDEHTALAKLTPGARGQMVGPRCEDGSWAGRPRGVPARRLLADLQRPASALRTGATVRIFPRRARPVFTVVSQHQGSRDRPAESGAGPGVTAWLLSSVISSWQVGGCHRGSHVPEPNHHLVGQQPWLLPKRGGKVHSMLSVVKRIPSLGVLAFAHQLKGQAAYPFLGYKKAK